MKKTILILSAILFIAGGCKPKNSNSAETQGNDITSTGSVPIVDENRLTQDLILYSLHYAESETTKSPVFVSLSDTYPWSEESSDLPDVPDLSNKENPDYQYIPLDSEYRNRFLSKANVAETDSVFIYDYAADILVALPVKSLKVIAYLNFYTGPDECPCPPYYYMLGFEINKNLLKGFSEYYTNTLVYVGKENPFVRGQMKAIIWEKTNPKEFPSTKPDSFIKDVLRGRTAGDVYTYKLDDFQYFIRNFSDNNPDNADMNPMYTTAKYLVVIDSKTKKVVVEKVYYSHESASPAPLNAVEMKEVEYYNQWTGNLFKNKPPVVFGFEYVSFGCPHITFLDKSENDIYISCDNRH